MTVTRAVTFAFFICAFYCQTFKSTCPQETNGCNIHNECTSCHETCEYCQSGSIECGALDCMTCVDESYQLEQIYGDGTGECTNKNVTKIANSECNDATIAGLFNFYAQNITLVENITCQSDSIIGIFDFAMETHAYILNVNQSLGIDIDTCNASTVVMVQVYSFINDSINCEQNHSSIPYCPIDTFCGTCDHFSNNENVQNFSMPIFGAQNQFYAIFATNMWFLPGQYQINFQCHPLKNLSKYIPPPPTPKPTPNPAVNLTKLFVSRKGTDYEGCGDSLDNTCGTIFGASKNLEFDPLDYGFQFDDVVSSYFKTVFQYGEIHVYDGQNETEIIRYLDSYVSNGNNPCLPQFTNRFEFGVVITFNPTFIKTMEQWYYKNLCNDTESWFKRDMIVFNNLIVNDYTLSNYLVSAVTVVCNNCTFSNILMKEEFLSIFDPKIQNIYLEDCKFNNIQSTNYLLLSQDIQNIFIGRTVFRNITVGNSLVAVFANGGGDNLFIDSCIFNNVAATVAIIDDDTRSFSSIIQILNTHFTELISGSIYLSNHFADQTRITLTNTQVSTSQFGTLNEYGLFEFTDADKVQINNLNLFFIYDMSILCRQIKEKDEFFITRTNVYCSNAVTLITNYGIVAMNNVVMYINILNET
eukprot:1129_1